MSPELAKAVEQLEVQVELLLVAAESRERSELAASRGRVEAEVAREPKVQQPRRPRQPRRTEGTMVHPKTEAEWAEARRFDRLMAAHTWTYAKTMPENPHYYTLRREWRGLGHDADFVWVEQYIRDKGYWTRFGNSWYKQVDVGDYFYWTFGWTIGTEEEGRQVDEKKLPFYRATTLINRKPLSQKGVPAKPKGSVPRGTAP